MNSFPELLQEWVDWYTESFINAPGESTSLLGRSQEALRRHQASTAFFDKIRIQID